LEVAVVGPARGLLKIPEPGLADAAPCPSVLVIGASVSLRGEVKEFVGIDLLVLAALASELAVGASSLDVAEEADAMRARGRMEDMGPPLVLVANVDAALVDGFLAIVFTLPTDELLLTEDGTFGRVGAAASGVAGSIGELSSCGWTEFSLVSLLLLTVLFFVGANDGIAGRDLVEEAVVNEDSVVLVFIS
jgi:hypothetical protein